MIRENLARVLGFLSIFGLGFGYAVRNGCANPQVRDFMGGQVVAGPSEEMCMLGDIAFFGGIVVLGIILLYKGFKWDKDR